MSNDSETIKNLFRYSVYKWREEKFIQNILTVTHSAKFSIHEISTDDGSKVYMVPQDFYKAVMLLSKQELENV